MKVKRDSRVLFLGKRVENLYILLGSIDFGGGIIKTRRVWKPLKKSIEGLDDKAPITTSVITTSTQSEDNHNGKEGLVHFMIDDVGNLKFVGDANLSNVVA